MEDSPHLYVSEFGHTEDLEEQDEEDNDDHISVSQDETNKDPGRSVCPNLYTHPNHHSDGGWDSIASQNCEKHFTSKPGFDQHMHIHALTSDEMQACKSSKSIVSFSSNVGRLQSEKIKSLDPEGSVMQLCNSASTNPNMSALSSGGLATQPEKQGGNDGYYPCKYCDKTFPTNTNKQRHERRFHKQHPRHTHDEINQQAQEKNDAIFTETSQSVDNFVPATVLGNEQTEQYMLDVSSNISENLSFYIDGKIVSTSKVSTCEAADVHSGSSVLVGLDALILDPTQISQVLNMDSLTCRDPASQPAAKRRTATPPLLPQIKNELESEVVVSSSSSAIVSSLIENLLPQNTESTVVPGERTVFLSPKLKQLLEKQDGLKPTLALITDGQKPCSPISLSVLPAGTGKFKRRTGSPASSPQHSPSNEDMSTADTEDTVSTGEVETQHGSLIPQSANENYQRTQSVEEPLVKPETWPPITGGSSCNQQPLDLSNSVKRIEDASSVDAVLDLSLQKKNLTESEATLNSKEGKSNACTVGESYRGEQNVGHGNPETRLGTDFTIVTASDIVTPVEPVAVYGLTLPPSSLAPSPASLNAVALQPASPCTIAFASPASHTMLPSASSLITVLAPSISKPSQPMQVLGSNISTKPLVLNSSDCGLTTAFATAGTANLVSLSQPLDPTLNLPGHVFLTDQIAINPPIVESAPVSDAPFPSNVSLNDPLINSYNITSNTVLIECTIALETPGSVLPTAITFQENPAEAPAPAQMVVNHIEQQQIVSVPSHQAVDSPVLVSSVEESLTLSTTTSVISDVPPGHELNPNPEHVADTEPPTKKEDNVSHPSVSIPDIPPESSQPYEKPQEDDSSDTPSDAQQQTFTKNFICNVCEELFHSMKELGHHVGDHADEWPYKCEFCVLLFDKPITLLDHRSSLHGVGKTYVCSVCTKEFVYFCNLKQHQEELHPGQQCTHTEEEKGKLRPQNYNSSKVNTALSEPGAPPEPKKAVKKEEGEEEVAAEELFTTIKIMASDGAKLKGPDVRLGINQHYPSFKPPPFPYHNRSPAASVASATNFTTHNIPQTFSTAIRCTKCGKSFDNMPELHKHILACANASDKRRYTPKKNPIPLRHFAKTQNGVLSTTNSTNELNAPNRATHSTRSKLNQESSVKLKFKVLNKRKKKLVHRVMPRRGKSNKVCGQVDGQPEIFVCPHCNREFTMRRSRTKHMAVCPQKPKEVRKRKQVGPSVTKENDDHLHRAVSHIEDTQQASAQHKTRLQSSGPGKRPAILPVQTVFSNKRSKIIIKESTQTKPETPALSELPIVRTFNPSMRQYTRVQHSTKGLPIKITILKPQKAAPQQEEPPLIPGREHATGAVTSSPESSSSA